MRARAVPHAVPRACSPLPRHRARACQPTNPLELKVREGGICAFTVCGRAMQQMQVTVPDGVGPGMPFIVNTPGGQMQVTCPVDANAGSPMIVNVPQAVVQAVTQATVVQAVAVPQAPAAMSRGKMDGRVAEIQSGCYTLSDCLCCYWAYYNVDANAGTVAYGPCCCVPMGCCPCPIPDETKIAVARDASDFKSQNGGEDVAWETATRMRKYNPKYDPPQGSPMHKCC